MTKKVIYKITRTEYEIIEVSTPEEENIIAELNRDTERTEKATARYHTRCSSYEELVQKGFAIVDDELTLEERYIENEEKEELQRRIRSAISKLTARQQEMVIMVFYEDKTKMEIAEYYKISPSAVSHSLERIYASLRKILEKI